MDNPKCLTCCYHKYSNGYHCQRYPKKQEVESDYWCGEHRSEESAEKQRYGENIIQQNFSVRTQRALVAAEIITMAHLRTLSDSQILKIRGVGHTSFKEIKRHIREWELS